MPPNKSLQLTAQSAVALRSAAELWRWAVLQAHRLGQHSLVQDADDFGYPVG